jgi:glutamate-1-semialdehyde 2,1-aminomutase
VRGVLAQRSLPVGFARLGSLFWLAMQAGEPPRRFDRVVPDGAARYAALHRALLERGVYFAPSAFEVGFLSLAHTEADVDATVAALGIALAEAYR